MLDSNGGIEMKEKDAEFEDPLDVPFEPSGDITTEGFKDHVEKYDAKRQLLFQEEFEVKVCCCFSCFFFLFFSFFLFFLLFCGCFYCVMVRGVNV